MLSPGNVALGGIASGSSPNIDPGRAVDGDRTPTYSANGGSCTLHTGGFLWNELFWHVDLGSFHVVHNVTVYGTIGNNYGKWYYQNNLFSVISLEIRLKFAFSICRYVGFIWKSCSCYQIWLHTGHNFWRDRVLQVGEGLSYERCGSLGDNDTASVVHVVCPNPLVGRNVRVKASGANSQSPRLFLCEVYVNGYRYVGTYHNILHFYLRTCGMEYVFNMMMLPHR